jgi:hypothetical protein
MPLVSQDSTRLRPLARRLRRFAQDGIECQLGLGRPVSSGLGIRLDVFSCLASKIEMLTDSNLVF